MDFVASSHSFPVFLPEGTLRLSKVGGAQVMSKCVIDSPRLLGAIAHVVATSAVMFGMQKELNCAIQCAPAVSVQITLKTQVRQASE